jgi:hypothetical protein
MTTEEEEYVTAARRRLFEARRHLCAALDESDPYELQEAAIRDTLPQIKECTDRLAPAAQPESIRRSQL